METSAGQFASRPWPWMLLVLGTIFLVFRDMLLGLRVPFFRDHLMMYLPRAESFRNAIGEGTIPLWDPLFLGGQPFAASPGRQVFYPPQYLTLIGDLGTGYDLLLVFHVVVAALGMFVALRHAGTRSSTAALGALTLGLSGFGMSMVHLVPVLTSVCWMPWVARFASGFLETRRPSEFLGATLALALVQLAGEPVQSLATGGMMVAWVFARPGGIRANALRGLGIDLLGILGIGICALLLASAQVWTAFDLMKDTVRATGLEFGMVSHWSFPPVRALEIAFSSVLDQIAPGGRLYASSGGVPLLLSVHVGLATCMLTLAGVIARVRGAGWLVFLAISCGVLAAGSHTPLLRLLYDAGIIGVVRYPVKFLIPVLVIAVFWSCLVLERLRDGDRRVWRALVGVAVAIPLLSLGFLASRIGSNGYWGRTTIVAVVIAVLLFSVSRAKGEGAALLLLLGVLVADLGAFSRRWITTMPAQLLEAPLASQTLDPDKQHYRILNNAALQLMDYGDPTAEAWFKAIGAILHRNGMFPMANGIWGYASVLEWDTEHTALKPTREFQRAMYDVRDSGQTGWLPMFATMANARYSTAFRPIEAAQLDGSANVLSIRPVDFIRVGESPRYYFASSLRRATTSEHFIDDLKRGDWAPGATWVGFEPFAPAGGEILEVVEHRHDIAVKVRANGRAFLNIAITPHRYWSATIDGANAPLHVANLGFQGIEVPAGEHTIELRYRNPVIAPAIGASVLTLIVLVAATLVLEAGRRRDARSGEISRSDAKTQS